MLYTLAYRAIERPEPSDIFSLLLDAASLHTLLIASEILFSCFHISPHYSCSSPGILSSAFPSYRDSSICFPRLHHSGAISRHAPFLVTFLFFSHSASRMNSSSEQPLLHTSFLESLLQRRCLVDGLLVSCEKREAR